MTKKQDKVNQVLHWYHWLVISASLFLTFIAWKVSDNQVQQKRAELFTIQTAQLLEQISERMSHYEVALKAGAATVQTFGQQTNVDQWKNFSDRLNLTDTYPGINGIGIIYHVEPNEIPQFVEQQRVFRPNFAIHPHHNNQEYWPITYIEPLLGNEKAVGLDMAFEDNRFSAAKKARDTGTAQITAPIILVQDLKKTPGFLQYIPFYKSTNLDTLEQRQLHFVGHVYAPFIMVKLMEGTLKQSNRQLVFSVFDGDDSLYDELIPNNSYYDANPVFKKTITIDMYGRPWTFNIQTALSFKSSTHSNQPLIILVGGIIIDGMLLFIFITLTRSQKQAIAIANKIMQTLSIREKYYKHIIESAPCGMIITNSQGDIEKVNPQIELIFGYKKNELIGNKIDMLIPQRYQDNHPKLRENYNHKPTKRQMGNNREVLGLTKQGNEFPAQVGLAQFKEGTSLKTLATIVDITEQVEITVELKRSNKELKDFAYVASHDLKAPLRGIMQISSWIEEDIADFATEDTKNNLALLMNRTSRLESLLEDLLTYSQIGRNVGEIQTVKVNELILNIFDLLSPPEDVTLHCDNTLPEITTHVVPLEIIFRNLIGNAIKHSNGDKLTINISANELPAYYLFSVEDNGPGIPERHHKHIFELFKTLKPRDEVEGSGMGLSIIKKLLDYQKCEINVISDGESGTCFTFTWPK